MRLILIFVLWIYSTILFGQQKQTSYKIPFLIDSVKNKYVERNIQNDILLHENYVFVYYSLSSNKEGIKIPEKINGDVVNNFNELIDAKCIIQKYDSTTKRYINEHFPFEELTMTSLEERKFFTLKKNNKYSNFFELPGLISKKGLYRIKLKLLLANFNKGVPNVISNWYYFTIEKDGMASN